MSPIHEFTGKRALVTGGTHGMGGAIVQRLSAGSATVRTTARSPADETALDPQLFIQADVSTAEGAATVAEAVLDRLGGIDIMVHNVGGSSSSTEGVLTMTDGDWERALAANLMAAVRLDRSLLPSMVRQRAGAIVHTTSIQRRFPLKATVPYAAAKAALAVYSKGLTRRTASGSTQSPRASSRPRRRHSSSTASRMARVLATRRAPSR